MATAEAVLSAGVASVGVTVAVLVKVPLAVGMTTTVSVALAPPTRFPTGQVTVGSVGGVHEEGTTETSVTPAGSVSVMTTLVAGWLPTLVAVTLNVRLEPSG